MDPIFERDPISFSSSARFSTGRLGECVKIRSDSGGEEMDVKLSNDDV